MTETQAPLTEARTALLVLTEAEQDGVQGVTVDMRSNHIGEPSAPNFMLDFLARNWELLVQMAQAQAAAARLEGTTADADPEYPAQMPLELVGTDGLPLSAQQ